tara:strand:+ start:11772 stop:11960 length:189 start_codon:yes stop_codon:yes gene_type:complete
MDETIEKIAKANITNLETLQTRGSDSLDFPDVAVWEIKFALEAAFRAGQKEANLNAYKLKRN